MAGLVPAIYVFCGRNEVCEPFNVHALLPTRQVVPAKVRCFLDALAAHAYARPPALADL
jgi:hypothetical protein